MLPTCGLAGRPNQAAFPCAPTAVPVMVPALAHALVATGLRHSWLPGM